MAPPYLDFWFDFASTYSYPAIMRVATLGRRDAASAALAASPTTVQPACRR